MTVFECNTDRRALLRLQNRLEQIDFKKIQSLFTISRCEKQINRIGVKKGLDKQSYLV